MDSDNEDYPVLIACTQEEISVGWDWNSPQPKPKRPPKRPPPPSPKVSFKRHPSSHTLPDLDKLRQELQSLREEISKPEHEETLRLSPVEELHYKSIHDDLPLLPPSQPLDVNFMAPQDEPLDFFDDELDDQFLMLSQQVERNLVMPIPIVGNESNRLKSLTFKKVTNTQSALDGTFNSLLKDVEMDASNYSSANRNIPSTLKHTKSDTFSDNAKLRTGKFEFHRTQSFEMANIENITAESGDVSKEIEKKRLEALAKLKSKQQISQVTNDVTSPMQCSPEEIEKKRREALAKREAKRQQEIIDRKRQEALKRLEMNRMKNATNVKSSLTSRLN
ncbi:unnamed protein product [Acanthoscelides obtectus]|uniref:Uncharacterized protein n=2 Tax=Acanthoscelides obtectus TaxID=200917 RepID=A0A9P0M9Q0_ACAOB|nr:unnamed protein product [Acanthoscelides obtectus]CAK1657872.1 hypothetical protein AOBTE_LOCUS20574 [Acanthoscelides obtectus]